MLYYEKLTGIGDETLDRNNLDKIAKTPEDRVLLARLWDKISAGMRKNILAATCFLAPREQEMANYLFGSAPGLSFFGGYPDSERNMLVYLPDYLDESGLFEEDSPIVCLRATYFQGDTLTHRDFLGALMGAGIAREAVGDICVGKGSCDFFVTEEISKYLLDSFSSAGRTRFRLSRVALRDAQIPEPEISEIKDTVASLRLDSVIASGFRIGRSLAAAQISAGKAAVNGLPVEKPDKPVSQGDKISLRGSGKILVYYVGGETKKGRISLVLHRYL